MSAIDDLIADAQAIPAAAFSRAKCVREGLADHTETVIDLTVPAQRAVMQIPRATISLIESAGEHFATLSR